MAFSKFYPTGPIRHYFEQISNLQRFKEEQNDRFLELTCRELEVLTLIAEGYNNPGIAEELNISRTTVQNHRAQIRSKLKIDSQSDFIKYALAYELIQF